MGFYECFKDMGFSLDFLGWCVMAHLARLRCRCAHYEKKKSKKEIIQKNGDLWLYVGDVIGIGCDDANCCGQVKLISNVVVVDVLTFDF